MTEHDGSRRALEPGWHIRAAENAGQLRNLYKRLDDLASGQHELLNADRTDELLDLLTRRSGLIDQIKVLTEELQPVLTGWDRLGASVPESVRASLQGAFDDIGALTETILARDSKHAEVLVEQKSKIAGELTSIDRGRAAVSAYSGKSSTGPQTPHFQDRQG